MPWRSRGIVKGSNEGGHLLKTLTPAQLHMATDDTCSFEECIVFTASCVGSEDDCLGEAFDQAFDRFLKEVSDAGFTYEYSYK